MGRLNPPDSADAVRIGLRLEFSDRRPERHFYGVDAGRYFYPRYLLHCRPLSLRRRRHHLRTVCRGLLLVSQDVLPEHEPDVGQDSLRANLYFLQRRVFPDALSWRWRPYAAHL